MEVRSGFRQFMRSEYRSPFRRNCREQCGGEGSEWVDFAHRSRDSGFYSVAGKACEHALDCLKRKSTENPKTDEVNHMMTSTKHPKTD
ncbi:hypothetical protein DVH24_038414 [Malus domestica]|uniref:Uncharacterized protein n=1 Tax=Malus domestica TaxID=3750 RepID=A0A498K7B5_MALDO|nr:hypothetical protein DVH24_038414 [Malus domestica]